MTGVGAVRKTMTQSSTAADLQFATDKKNVGSLIYKWEDKRTTRSAAEGNSLSRYQRPAPCVKTKKDDTC